MYHTFQPNPKGVCTVCRKSRMSAFHMMPDRIDREMSKRIREQPKEAWTSRSGWKIGEST